MIAFHPSSDEERVQFIDLHPDKGDLVGDAIRGLKSTPKSLPCKYFYDALGAALFDAITELPEYYPTRTELAIMNRHVQEMAQVVGRHATLVEFGSGASVKTQKLLDALHDPAGCVLVEINEEGLQSSAAALADRYPGLNIVAACGDYTQSLKLPRPVGPSARTVAYFPGSTIGNFTPDDAQEFLLRVAQLVGVGGGFLVGIDRKKDHAVLEAAYNDSLGVTAAFNLNVLRRLNQAGADFDLSTFTHEAPYNTAHGRIEMHLISNLAQTVRVGTTNIDFEQGERILTEYSHKYDLEQFAKMAEQSGMRMTHHWSDERDWFSVCFLEVLQP